MTGPAYRAIREALGLTQHELAEKLGVTKRTIINREQGGHMTQEAAMAIRFLQLHPARFTP